MIPNEDDPDSASTAPEGVAEPAKPSGSLVSWRKSAFLAPVAILALILYFVRLPYFVLQPGPAEDVEPLIHIQSQQTYPGGHLLLTSVGLYQPNAYQAFWAWVDRAESVVPERDILAPGETPQEETQQAISQMDTSKIDAAVVALTKYAGYPARHGRGVLVESVLSGSPASGKLFAGDVVLSVDGRRVADPDQLGRMIRAAGVGHALTFEVKADGQTRRVQVAPGRIQGIDHPAIGIGTVAAFPFPLEIDSGDIGGPSAGLMWTLGMVDLLTPGDLTGGRIVAGTGTIDLTGKVGPIGGISQKVVAAERAGATVFFAPAEEASQARSVAHHIVVVPVRSYTDAVSYLGGPAS